MSLDYTVERQINKFGVEETVLSQKDETYRQFVMSSGEVVRTFPLKKLENRRLTSGEMLPPMEISKHLAVIYLPLEKDKAERRKTQEELLQRCYARYFHVGSNDLGSIVTNSDDLRQELTRAGITVRQNNKSSGSIKIADYKPYQVPGNFFGQSMSVGFLQTTKYVGLSLAALSVIDNSSLLDIVGTFMLGTVLMGIPLIGVGTVATSIYYQIRVRDPEYHTDQIVSMVERNQQEKSFGRKVLGFLRGDDMAHIYYDLVCGLYRSTLVEKGHIAIVERNTEEEVMGVLNQLLTEPGLDYRKPARIAGEVLPQEVFELEAAEEYADRDSSTLHRSHEPE
jgi:hypothetical protein